MLTSAFSSCSLTLQGLSETQYCWHYLSIFVHFRWLVAQGREDEAYAVLQKLHFNGENKEWLDGEFSEICEVKKIISDLAWLVTDWQGDLSKSASRSR